MIVFIALILVAAVASTIVISSVERLSQQSESTVSDVQNQLSQKMEVESLILSQPACSAELWQHSAFTGWSVTFSLGNYDNTAFIAAGATDNDASSIKVAEAAKVIENAQRDINIAFVNEVAQICHKLGIASANVLAAAGTKWNFLDFKPGLVGGHCIGVDPYYLAHRARKAGHTPEVILAGRHINDSMADFVVGEITSRLPRAEADILVLGLTFKKNVPDLRNSLVAEVVNALSAAGHRVDVHDPHADTAEAKALYGIDLSATIPGNKRYDCLVGAVSHNAYHELGSARIADLLSKNGLLADIAGLWHKTELPQRLSRWQL